jgi:hypothetical protein
MHSTFDLNDGYIGSGLYLWRSIQKYGRNNFKTEILEYCKDRASVVLREKEIVTITLINEPLCMNLITGGGKLILDYSPTAETRTKLSDALKGKTYAEIYKSDIIAEEQKQKHSLGMQKRWSKLSQDERQNIANAVKQGMSNMTNEQKENCKENVRQQWRNLTDDERELKKENLRNAFNNLTDEHKEKIRKDASERVLNMSEDKLKERTAKFKQTIDAKSEDDKQKRREKLRETSKAYFAKMTEEEREAFRKKKREIAKNQYRPVYECPHCGKSGKSNFKLFHFDNCKLKH